MNYYREKLSGKRLKLCYDTAPARIKQYLQAEIEYVISHIEPTDSVLELGCGYGRVTIALAEAAREVTGIDNAAENLQLARKLMNNYNNINYFTMDAICMDFPEASFDLVACIQNGICAFRVDQTALIKEALRVTRPGGKVIFSSYSAKFWEERLKWFALQAKMGLVGEIDYSRTGNGVIVCRDGFNAAALQAEDFKQLFSPWSCEVFITEVDTSSIFCVAMKKSPD
ncbi:MAG: class I SAM-dependent methyltransferase [Candidatus Cloacimonetes bacterium]|nr:class I SAM-dependent methyltransferase [Candidatus Cloacimonadota bacterium]